MNEPEIAKAPPPKVAPDCQAAHTKYEPTADEWKCPKCGAPGSEFAIDEPADGASDQCERLHKNDFLHCYKCGHNVSGARFSNAIMKAKNLVPCPTCKGHGLVDGSKK